MTANASQRTGAARGAAVLLPLPLPETMPQSKKLARNANKKNKTKRNDEDKTKTTPPQPAAVPSGGDAPSAPPPPISSTAKQHGGTRGGGQGGKGAAGGGGSPRRHCRAREHHTPRASPVPVIVVTDDDVPPTPPPPPPVEPSSDSSSGLPTLSSTSSSSAKRLNPAAPSFVPQGDFRARQPPPPPPPPPPPVQDWSSNAEGLWLLSLINGGRDGNQGQQARPPAEDPNAADVAPNEIVIANGSGPFDVSTAAAAATIPLDPRRGATSFSAAQGLGPVTSLGHARVMWRGQFVPIQIPWVWGAPRDHLRNVAH
ncbi:hypothetical protein ISF_01015 [Cordyceps fumosorosea ARSEF 2679]|uniref:Uncharacterized protein n=1 Tax=Cordyceps fumosorosea (strain ARSEF 2679) TaxID=1081104 RepID=A0A162LQE4_CORFA|nr:hypothetical protein ISF_01015 [Cordyceps fumosorosea ARSEF 2679]OAA74114.1 hypothetical protein ISF_01015 [Cordyceps fumosorosea ARSEF 2679]